MGKVFLAGAGPGDPELLTIRAAKLLARADVVLHDALVPEEILEMVNPGAIVVDVGKRKGNRFHTQDEIHNLLVAYAQANETVVRLKGGDPALFGRLGEELEALRASDIDFEIVPGITAAMAGAAAAGISLTDRRITASVIFITGQRKAGADDLDWHKFVATGSTLAIYMPGSEYAELCERLCNAGLESSTPCAVISSVSRTDQSVLWTELGSLSKHASLPAPSIVIVGECARAQGDARLDMNSFAMLLANTPPPSEYSSE